MRYLIMLALLMSGCTVFHEKPLPPSEATHVDLKVVWVESVADVPKTNNDWRIDAQGAAKWFDLNGVRFCTIYAIKPYGDFDFERLHTLGHELLHCTDGRYHSRYGQRIDESDVRLQ